MPRSQMTIESADIDMEMNQSQQQATKRNFSSLLSMAAFRVFNPCTAAASAPLMATEVIVGPTVSASLIGESPKSRRNILLQWAIRGLVLSQILLRLLPIIEIYAVRFTHFYLAELAAFPIITKSITSAVIGIMGDVLAQRFGLWFEGRNKTTNSIRMTQPVAPGWYDRRRGISIFFDGLIVTGPFLHFAYEALERLIPIHDNPIFSPAMATFAQVLIDDFVLDSVFVALLFTSTAIGEGHVRDLPRQFREDFLPTIKIGLIASALLLPAAYACFRYVPLSLRVFGVNIITIFWGGAVSYGTHRNRHQKAGEVDEETDAEEMELLSSAHVADPTLLSDYK